MEMILRMTDSDDYLTNVQHSFDIVEQQSPSPFHLPAPPGTFAILLPESPSAIALILFFSQLSLPKCVFSLHSYNASISSPTQLPHHIT